MFPRCKRAYRVLPLRRSDPSSLTPTSNNIPLNFMTERSDIDQRKLDHLNLCNEEEIESRERRTLLDEVHFMHDSLPELAVDDIDLSVEMLGKRLHAPLMISGMTGGTERAREINRRLAALAQERGFAFGVGSQRAMQKDPAQARTYEVRDIAPDILLFGNLGAVQVAQSSTQELADLAGAIGADALCVHLNPAQEIVQEGGDRDFRGCLDAIARLVEELDIPVVAKETGCGMSPGTLRRLKLAGVKTVDVSGAGGTTWVGVEALRAQGALASVGDVLWDWGVPTAAAVAWAKGYDMTVIASGGIRNGLDAARAIALGADVASCALPWLRAAMSDNPDSVEDVADNMLQTLQAVMLLTGSSNVDALRKAPRYIGPELKRWLEQS